MIVHRGVGDLYLLPNLRSSLSEWKKYGSKLLTNRNEVLKITV